MMLEDGLVWVDLEMTGLDPDRDVVIEIATIVTDAHLKLYQEVARTEPHKVQRVSW